MNKQETLQKISDLGLLAVIRGPYPQIPMMPTGGVDMDNISEWFEAGAFAVGAGSNLCPSAWAKDGRFAGITERANGFVKAIERARRES